MPDLDLEHLQIGGRPERGLGERSVVEGRMRKIRQPMTIHIEVKLPAQFNRPG